ncbi:lantibiotic dehydratase [Micromonospora sp. BRA006-A]|nr:lantibiotic dehydratase [Micromonospora sp. BRA006-A]
MAGELAADPLLREAVTWQNPDMLIALDGLLRTDPQVRNARRRKRELSLLRYWQRYCGKAETIGFFGPVCWGTFDATGPACTPRPATRWCTGGGCTSRRGRSSRTPTGSPTTSRCGAGGRPPCNRT